MTRAQPGEGPRSVRVCPMFRRFSGPATGLRLRSVRLARPTHPKELPGVPPSAGHSLPVGTKTCRLIFLFTRDPQVGRRGEDVGCQDRLSPLAGRIEHGEADAVGAGQGG